MRLPILLTAVLLLAGCSDTVGGPSGSFSLQTRNALEILPSGADMAGMVNLQAARQSGIFDDHESPFSPGNMDGESASRFNEFMQLTGFNPDEDLRRVYMTVTGTDGEHAHPAFVVYADFDRARIDTYIDDNAPEEVTRTTYNDTPVYMVTEDDGTFGIGLINDEMAVGGEQSELFAMIDRVANGTQGLSGDSEMMALIERAAFPDGAWFAVRKMDYAGGPDADDNMPMADMGNVALMMGSGVMSFDFGNDEVEMTALGIPRDNANLGDVADMLRGSIAVMRTAAQQENPAMAEMLDGVRVRETGDAVQVQAVLEPALFEQMHGDHKH